MPPLDVAAGHPSLPEFDTDFEPAATYVTLEKLYEAHADECGFGPYEEWLVLGRTLPLTAELPGDAFPGCDSDVEAEEGPPVYDAGDTNDQWQEMLKAQRETRVIELIHAEERAVLRSSWAAEDAGFDPSGTDVFAEFACAARMPRARGSLPGRTVGVRRVRRATARGKPREPDPDLARLCAAVRP